MRTVMTIDDNEENTYESKWTVNRRSLNLNQLHILNICNDDDDGDDDSGNDDHGTRDEDCGWYKMAFEQSFNLNQLFF